MKAMIFLAGAAMAAPAMATVYTDSASFLGAIQGDYFYNNFAGVAPGPAASLNYSGNGYSYTITAGFGGGTGNLYNDPGLISTDSALDHILVTFTSGNVTAVGGNMYATDISFFPIMADVTVALSDGTSVTYTSSSASDFRGFTSNVAITSLTIDASDSLANAWSTLQNFYVGAVPAPGAMALLGFGGLAAARRRR